MRRRYAYGQQGKDFVPLDDEERRTWKQLLEFKRSPIEGSADMASGGAGVKEDMSFAVMDKDQRAVVHRLANILGLQHQS